jgi:hypothetical protein
MITERTDFAKWFEVYFESLRKFELISKCHFASPRFASTATLQASCCELMAVQTPTVNRESRVPAPNWRKHSHSPTLRLRHRFTTFWRVGTPIHNFGRRDSQVRGPDSQLGSQLLAGKWLEWRSLNRDRHSHGASSPHSYQPTQPQYTHLPPRLPPPMSPVVF